jgi:hypothetical protein
MKKLISSALLALAVSGFAASTSFAGCAFGLFYNHGCCGCGAKFCVRQYNAFSPVCSGTVFCNGCCPFGSGGGYGPGYPGGAGACAGGMCPGGACGGVPFSGVMGCPTGGCADGSCLGSLPATESVTPDGTTSPASNPVVMPSPLPTQTPATPTSQTANYRPIQNTAYRPVSYPVPSTPSPARMQPQIMVAPSYWSN